MSLENRSSLPLPAMPDERSERLWKGVLAIDRARRTRRRRARWATVAGGAVLAALAAVFVLRPKPAAILADPAAFELRTGIDRQEIVFRDGTRITLDDATRLSLVAADAHRVRFDLKSGSLDGAVTANPARIFEVEIGDEHVETNGGSFRLEVVDSGAHLAVTVQRGEVVVRKGVAELARLGAGQRWASDPPPAEPAVSASASSPIAATPSPMPAPTSDAAEALFGRADAAHLDGRDGEAARLFDEYRARFPNAPNAGFAAFEAGRIHLANANPKRAAAAFSFAATHGDPAFREDAKADLVDALAQLGDSAACRRARDAYLEHYPGGAHVARVTRLCP